MHHLVYLHGFLSSPQSVKAQSTLAFAKQHFPSLNVHIPELPGDISKAVGIIDNLLCTLPINRTGFIGSSMGGYLSTYCIEKYASKANICSLPKAVLINPAVEPFTLLADYMGQHRNPYTNEVFYVKPPHITMLKRLYVNTFGDPLRYKVLLQKEDETLDYKLAAKKYARSALTIEDGGDHSFVNYESHLPDIFRFLMSK
jgi:predicted esterase YcpF (UPF0227 family)